MLPGKGEECESDIASALLTTKVHVARATHTNLAQVPPGPALLEQSRASDKNSSSAHVSGWQAANVKTAISSLSPT